MLLGCTSLASHGQVMVTRNVDYLAGADYDKGKDLLDIFVPAQAENVPIIVYFHGGALLRGDKSGGTNLGLRLAGQGIGLVSVNYRLSPNVEFPAHLDDAKNATSWVIDNIENYGGDKDRIYVAGHSAGAYLAALLAIDGSQKANDQSILSQISGSILISPFLYVEETAKDRIARDPVHATIWGEEEDQWEAASVTPHILPGRNNSLLIYADGDEDWRKTQILTFANAMRQADNANIQTIEVPDRNHSSLLTAILAEDDQVSDLIVEFVQKRSKPVAAN